MSVSYKIQNPLMYCILRCIVPSPHCHKVSRSAQTSPLYFFIHPLLHIRLSISVEAGQVRVFQTEASSFHSQFAFALPSPPFLLLHLHLPFPPAMPSFHYTAPCVLSNVGQASSVRQGEPSAPIMTACPSEYTFLSFPALPPPTLLPLWQLLSALSSF